MLVNAWCLCYLLCKIHFLWKIQHQPLLDQDAERAGCLQAMPLRRTPPVGEWGCFRHGSIVWGLAEAGSRVQEALISFIPLISLISLAHFTAASGPQPLSLPWLPAPACCSLWTIRLWWWHDDGTTNQRLFHNPQLRLGDVFSHWASKRRQVGTSQVDSGELGRALLQKLFFQQDAKEILVDRWLAARFAVCPFRPQSQFLPL